MRDDMIQTALATWAAKDIPARFLAEQVAKLLNCSTDDVAIPVSAGKLRALGRPRPNAVKFFSSIELIILLADPDWLDDATKAIVQYWRRKKAKRNGLTLENWRMLLLWIPLPRPKNASKRSGRCEPSRQRSERQNARR